MVKILNIDSGIVHSATKTCREEIGPPYNLYPNTARTIYELMAGEGGIGTLYRLLCGNIVYVGRFRVYVMGGLVRFRTQYVVTLKSAITCKHCLRKELMRND